MKKDEKLRMILREVSGKFEKEKYEDSLLELEKASKLIIQTLNAYNRRNR